MSESDNYYLTPKGSQDIPHPRTIPDIISRSLFIHLCAALAYALLLSTIQRISRQRSGSGIAYISNPQWIWNLCSVLLPELVLVQLGLWSIHKLFPCAAELLGANLTLHNQRRGSANGAKSIYIRTILIQAVVLVIPLVFAYKGYRQRLAMRYHEATYVGNLGLDHRNGWAAISGLASSTAIFALLLVAVIKMILPRRAHDNKISMISSRSDQIITDSEEEDGYGEKDTCSHNDARKESNDLSQQINDQDYASFRRKSDEASRLGLVDLFNNLDAMLPLVLTVLIHQVLLAVTNRYPPLLALFTKPWCFLFVPIVCISFWLLPRPQQQLARRAIASRKWNDLPLPFSVLLQNAMIIASWLLIGSTIVVQAWCDVAELGSAGAGRMQEWNYRWRVKDLFSHGDNDRVYMG